MKKYLMKALLVIFMTVVCFPAWAFAQETASGEDQGQQAVSKENQAPEAAVKKTPEGPAGIENILFAKLPGKERIHIVVSRQPYIEVKSKVVGSYQIKMKNVSLPPHLARLLGEGELNNITGVTPYQEIVDNEPWVYLNISANKIVPYSIRQEGNNILVDFNVAGLEEKKSKAPVAKVSAAGSAGEEAADKSAAEKKAAEAKSKRLTDRIISLDFQDADIKSVFRLMAEYGNVSIVTSDEVKGTITLTMKNVPWTKALDTILDVNSLAKREEGNVIIITTLKRQKENDDARMKAAEDEKKRKEQEHKEKAEKGLLKQIMIEAKIVEATEEFVRNIGIQWGFGNQQKVSHGTYGLGVTGGSGIQTANRATTPTYSQLYPPEIAATDSAGKRLAMAAVNFPSQIASPAIGLVFGGATGFLEAQLAALETNTMGKVISSPKVVTMEGIKAIIKQGDDVPYVTPASGTSPATVSFKEAVLQLEVTPRVTEEGKISMEIKASNDVPDYAKAATLQGNPPIRKSEVESKVVINDGDTVVIGGIVKSQEDKTVSGWPFLQKIPVLGWLFKTEDVSKAKRQLLIFVTPRILKDG
jgi:type IV pilus assembly protein PilQ